MKESKQTYRVAIADDDELAIRALSDITSEIPGFSVDLVACNGKELYDKLNAAEVLPDIVMLDISMPVWDGYQTIHALKKKWPDIKVLVITMHKHEFGIIKMLKNDANGYLLKNSKPQEIKKALQSIAEKGKYHSDIASEAMQNKINAPDTKTTLSDREIQFLRLSPTDLTYPEMAKKMKISDRSVAGIRSSLFNKFNVTSREELIVCAIQMGILFIE